MQCAFQCLLHWAHSVYCLANIATTAITTSKIFGEEIKQNEIALVHTWMNTNGNHFIKALGKEKKNGDRQKIDHKSSIPWHDIRNWNKNNGIGIGIHISHFVKAKWNDPWAKKKHEKWNENEFFF